MRRAFPRLLGPKNFREVRMGCACYHRNELGGDVMYRMSRRTIDEYWGNPAEVTNAVAVLLLTWNQAAYRYGPPDFRQFKQWMVNQWHVLSPLRRRDLSEFDVEFDADWVLELFESALQALKSRQGNYSPVGVVKALHLLAPDFFPLWDDRIARSYGCKWERAWEASEKYVRFMLLTQSIMGRLVETEASHRRFRPQVALWFMCQYCPIGARWNSFLKMLDEYNYVRYTKAWFEEV